MKREREESSGRGGEKPEVARSPARSLARSLLMCPPDAYDLKYEINAWMSLKNKPDRTLAARQWRELYRLLTGKIGARVELVRQAPNAPDMVFTANAGLVRGNRVLLSNFRHPERQVEVAPFRAWFEARGFEVVAPPEDCKFEGEGDALFVGDVLAAGYLKRSDICGHNWLSETLGVPVLSLELTDDRWYHLDTAFFALTPERIACYPGAFDYYGRTVLYNNFEVIEVVEEEALNFGCNAIVLDTEVVMPARCPRLQDALESRGYRVYPIELSEFIKSGGAAKCLTLFLDKPSEADLQTEFSRPGPTH
jgi:N-dimethylarginine dimethylaminohydrolase